MPIFFLTPEARDDASQRHAALVGETLTITGPLARHLGASLRHQPGDRIMLVDEVGARCVVEVTQVRPNRIDAMVRERLGAAAPPRLSITLAQAVLKSSHMDYVLQKATELGVARFVPLITRRTVIRPRRERESHQVARWKAVLIEAAQQSGRGWIPHIESPLEFERFCALAVSHPEAVRLMLWEGERARGLREALAVHTPLTQAVLVVGPEGGFDRDEVATACKTGFVSVSLGNATLRAETAGPAAVAILQYLWGDLGNRPTDATDA